MIYENENIDGLVGAVSYKCRLDCASLCMLYANSGPFQANIKVTLQFYVHT